MRHTVPFLGTPPSHWRVLRNKAVFAQVDERSVDGSEELLTVSHLTGVTPRSEKNVTMFEAASLDGYKVCRPGDLVINTMWAWMGALGVSPQHGIVSPSYHVYRLRRTDDEPRYFHYLFRTPAYVAEINKNSRGVWTSRLRLYPEEFGDMECFIPPQGEQRRIAGFLDRKTADIDALVTMKEALLGLVESRWASLVHRIVTQGLDPRAILQPSGHDWIGLVPLHWRIAPIYSFCEVQLGKMLSPAANQGESPAPYLRNTNVQWDRVLLDDLNLMDFSPSEREKFALREGDLLVCEGGDVGRAAVWEGEMDGCFYQKALHRVRLTDPSSVPRYLMYSFWAASIYGEFQAEGNQATIIHLTAEKLRAHRTPVPPLDEQHRIVAFLDAARGAANQTAEALVRQIELLNLHRQSLITAAVTGQLDLSSDPSLPAGV